MKGQAHSPSSALPFDTPARDFYNRAVTRLTPCPQNRGRPHLVKSAG
jgi:hypothetical protein